MDDDEIEFYFPKLFGEKPMHIIDVGGQDTKVISASGGRVEEFYMNDKCSAGTGKFAEIMANRGISDRKTCR